MSKHPLTTYFYETFGQQFGSLLLIGYGAEPGRARRRLYVTESEGGIETDWVIRLVTDRPPCRDEPLALAALLKLLLCRPSPAQYLEFDLGELITMLQWRDDARTRRHLETAISCYVRLLYEKQVDSRAGRRMSEYGGGGYYHLLNGYFRMAKSSASQARNSTSSGVYFDAAFVEGLRRGRVYFAGIDFGQALL